WSAPAHWSMGLLDPSDWQASWIGDPTPLPERRPANNGYHSAFATSADVSKSVEIDLGPDAVVDGVRLWPARPYDWPDTPGFLFPLRFRIDLSDRADFLTYKTVVDRTAEDVPNPGTDAPLFTFAPQTARYVRMTATRLRLRDANNYG